MVEKKKTTEAPRFDRSKRYINLKTGRKIGKGVWYDAQGKMIKPGQGRFEGENIIAQYNMDGSISRFTKEQWAKKKQGDLELKVLQRDRRFAIPYIPSKRMTIYIDDNSPTSRAHGAVISENLLDSIAVNAKRAGLPFRDALGMASQESTLNNATTSNSPRNFGLSPIGHFDYIKNAFNQEDVHKANGSYNNGNMFYSPTLMVSNWKQYTENKDAPFAQFLYTSGLESKPFNEGTDENNYKAAVRRNNRIDLIPEISPLQDAFERYKANPSRYNPGDDTYPSKVRSAGDELINYSPEIRAYMQRNHIHAEGGDLDNVLPEVEVVAKYPHEQRVIDTMNASNAEFIQRLRNNDFRAIHNADGSYSTHVLGSADNIVFPAIQDVNGDLKDYRDMSWQKTLDRAIQNNDYIEFPTEGDARYFGEHYKKYFPNFFNRFRDNQYAEGGQMGNIEEMNDLESTEESPKHWSELSMSEKSDVMSRAIEQGITSLSGIRKAWDEYVDDNVDSTPEEENTYADGGYLFKEGGPIGKGKGKQKSTGYRPSQAIKTRIANWEGSSMRTNKSFDEMANQFNQVIPAAVRSHLSQAQLDSLYSYGYNVGMNRLKERTLPTLIQYINGQASATDVANHMWATQDKNYRGLMNRRNAERSMFVTGNAATGEQGPVLKNNIVFPSPFGQSYNMMDAYDINFPQEEEKPQDQTVVPDVEYKSSPWDVIGRMRELFGATGNDNNAVNVLATAYSNSSSPIENIIQDLPTSNTASQDNILSYLSGEHKFGPGGHVAKKASSSPIDQAYTNFAAQMANRNIAAERGNDATTLSNDATWVDSGKRVVNNGKRLMTVSRRQNPHLVKRGLQGARAHADWARKHPIAETVGNIAGAVPLAVATAPMATVAGDAVAGTALGQTVTGGLTGLNTLTANSTWFPWVNAAVDGYYLADANDNIRTSNITPETVLELAPAIGVGKGIAKEAAKGIQEVPYLLGRYAPSSIKNFTRGKSNPDSSILDWAPENWFGTRIKGLYDAEDVAALNSHVPEYRAIEREAKKNGIWLQMPDGSTWKGDPRSWVQMQSKDYNRYTGNSPFKYEAFVHTSPYKFNKFDIKHFGKTDSGFYGRGFYSYPAEYINGKLTGRNNYGSENYLLTTNVQSPFYLDNPNFEYAGLFNRGDSNFTKEIFDGYDAVYYGLPGNKTVGASPSELVAPKSNNYKSLLGNNGNFNPLDLNIYKGLIPLGILGTTTDN